MKHNPILLKAFLILGAIFLALNIHAQNGCTAGKAVWTNCYAPHLELTTPPPTCVSNAITISVITPPNGAIVVTYTSDQNCHTTNSSTPLSASLISVGGWTAYGPGSFQANGGGASATFTPTNCGTGSIVFTNVIWRPNSCGDTNTYTNDMSGSYCVVELLGLSVSGAIPVDSKNYAIVKTTNANDYVYISPILCCDRDEVTNMITLSGGEAAPEAGPLTRKVNKNVSAKTTVTASLCGKTYEAVIWILWGSVNIQASGTNPPNSPDFPTYEPEDGDQLGVQYTSSSDAAAGKVCIIGTLTPSGLHNVISNGWSFAQFKTRHSYMDGSVDVANTFDEWTPEGLIENSVPDSDDKIYAIDGPTIAQFLATTSYRKSMNFYDLVTWNGFYCSPTNNFWHFDGTWTATNSPQADPVTVGGGLMTLP